MQTKMDIYQEKLSSKRTAWLFVTLTILFFLLFVWRLNLSGWDGLTITFLVFSFFFLFYAVNYRTLVIQISSTFLILSFGIFSWRVPFDNIESCSLDEVPALKKYGGAGIHFMLVRKRYRASFNFLEYPRVLITFKDKVGPVQDISFSTCQPEEILRIIQKAISI